MREMIMFFVKGPTMNTLRVELGLFCDLRP